MPVFVAGDTNLETCKKDWHIPAASSGIPARPPHLSLCHEPTVKKRRKHTDNRLALWMHCQPESALLVTVCTVIPFSVEAA